MRVGVGDQGEYGLSERALQLFTIDEEEQLVFLDRTAKAAAELILTEGWFGRAIKKVASIQGTIAEELVQRSMEGVSAGEIGRAHV